MLDTEVHLPPQPQACCSSTRCTCWTSSASPSSTARWRMTWRPSWWWPPTGASPRSGGRTTAGAKKRGQALCRRWCFLCWCWCSVLAGALLLLALFVLVLVLCSCWCSLCWCCPLLGEQQAGNTPWQHTLSGGPAPPLVTPSCSSIGIYPAPRTAPASTCSDRLPVIPTSHSTPLPCRAPLLPAARTAYPSTTSHSTLLPCRAPLLPAARTAYPSTCLTACSSSPRSPTQRRRSGSS